jgi:dephospho-CoA kinase
MTRPFVLGVTGNIACGKSTVLHILAGHGASTIDADTVYHNLIVPQAPLWHTLHRRFGDRILNTDATINRRALGAIVFADPTALADLDQLTHPAIEDEIRRRIAVVRESLVVVDAVKLIESGFADECDAVWLVVCDRPRQLERLIARNHLSHRAAEQRLDAQPPLGPKLSRADVVIDNSGSLEETRRQVERAAARLPSVNVG